MGNSSLLRKRLRVDEEKCLGCLACANVCPVALITLSEDGARRTLRFAPVCDEEECTRCVDACPEGAISLIPAAEMASEEPLVLTFDLARCAECGTPFTSQDVVSKLLSVVPSSLGAEPEDLAWLRLCPECRRLLEGREMAREARWVRLPSIVPP